MRHKKQTVCEHGRNLGFRMSSSNRHMQTPQVTKSFSSFSSLQAVAILSTSVAQFSDPNLTCRLLLCLFTFKCRLHSRLRFVYCPLGALNVYSTWRVNQKCAQQVYHLYFELCQATCVASFPYGLGALFKIYGALFKLRLKNL